MSLNPVQFGKDVIDQFGRYLLTTFPVADERLAAQVRDRMRHTVGGESLLYKGPYVYLNRPFQPGPAVDDLVRAGRLHEVIRAVFPYGELLHHQAETLDAVQAGQHVILSTGTGSGKTEAFMLPIIDHCLRLRDRRAPDGVVAVLIYPMNALVNDQLDRLRMALAGTGVTYGRYTGETPDEFSELMHRYNAPVAYTARQRQAYKEGTAAFGDEALPFPWEEAVDKDSIRARRPRLLLTNYAQLEYLLLRDRDLELFRGAPLRFMVFDEVHTYTGALGSEVACLIRRLRDVTRKSAADVLMIGTSATVSDRPDDAVSEALDPEAATRRFAHRLFGVPAEQITVIRESYRSLEPRDTYLPPLPPDMPALLDDLLVAARDLQLQTEVEAGDIPADLVALTAHLCSADPPATGSGMDQLVALLYSNRCVVRLSDLFTEPRTWDEVLPAWRRLDVSREHAADDDLIAEMLAYLTLGALAQYEGDPLLRPKLHYFLQGLQGLGIAFYPGHDPLVTFDDREGAMPLLLCRSCGQHYTRLIIGRKEASNDSRYGYFLARVPTRFEEPDEGEETRWAYLTDQFHTEAQDEDDEAANWPMVYVCPTCYTVHEKNEPRCLNPKCRTDGPLILLRAWGGDADFGEPKRCGACGGPNTRKTPLISYTRSAGVADVTILAQSMLTMMSEPTLRKLLIFADSRQDAAFQAGWMQERAKRFRLRHLAYQLAAERKEPWGWSSFVDEMIARAQQEGILPRRDFDNVEQQTQVRWFLIEEFAFITQRRSNLEQLGLVGLMYGDLYEYTDDPLFIQWAERFSITPTEILNVVQVLLDTYRRRGMLSDDLLARWWDDKDREVHRGWINVPDFYRPKALVLEKVSRNPSLVSWIASNGRATAQLIVQKALDAQGQLRDSFLKVTWQWLVEHEFLVPVELVLRRYGRVEAISGLPADVYHVNVGRIGLYETHDRYVCTHCHRAQQVLLPTGLCPEYNCNGRLLPEGRDHEHFDVVQYTRHEFVPMKAREHSAQVPQERRLEAERSFKSESGTVNVIVATPTLEMGVDIGKLEMTMMRNVPPTPANYAQRAGRAGRRHRIAAVFTYAGGSQHDRYFFNDPPEMIAGAVRIPAFSMRNEPLIRKHVHSATLTILRELVRESEREVLETAFPAFIRSYLAEFSGDGERTRLRYFTEPPRFPAFADLIHAYREPILRRLVDLFERDWPADEREAVVPELLARYLEEMTPRLERHVRLLFSQVKAYRQTLAKLREIEERHQRLDPDERKLRQRLEQARDSYMQTTMDNYTLSWLSVDGFFPGYALSRESVAATCIQPLMQLSRPAPVALRELTPANWVYADGRVFSVQRLNFNKLKAENENFSSDLLRETMAYDRSQKRLYDPARAGMEGGETRGQTVVSYQLTDVEMELEQNIDDRRDIRRRVAFEIGGMLLDSHSGGHQGRVGECIYQYLAHETVRLVNVGPVRLGPTGVQGFPLCPVCGETRSPQASPVEIDHFREVHREQCGVSDITVAALHVEIESDVLRFGPFESHEDAVNAYEGLLVGARLVLDMNQNDLEGMVVFDENDAAWAVLYDTLPGGTGFLPQLLDYWDVIGERGIEALMSCTCEKACYQCLQHFRNQQYHTVLDRGLAAEQLARLRGVIQRQHTIPARVAETPDETVDEMTESPAEDKFLRILEARHFPLPSESQLPVDLGNGNYTVADFAWPEAHVLVFIDGTSMRLHGDPDRARRDRNKRRQAELLGWHVVVITAQELDDEQALALKLEDIAFFLEQRGE
jgi:hypothetical protein